MEIRQVSAKHGWYWITKGFQMFRKAPMIWMLICFIPFLIAVTLTLMIPMLGAPVFMLIAPVFLAGIMVACFEQDQGRPIEVAHLFVAFKAGAVPLMTVGGIFFLGLIVIYSLFISTGGGDLVAMLQNNKRYDSSEIGEISSGILSSFLLVIVLQIPLLMAFIFSPVLIILHNFSPFSAMQKSFFACLRNIIPFFVYNLVVNLLSIIVLILPYIGLVILSPVLFASIYVSYKEIFLGEQVDIPENYGPNMDYQKANWSDVPVEPIRKEQNETPTEEHRKTQDEDIVIAADSDIAKCYQCDILIPKEEAIRFDGKFFCSDKHFQEYQDSMRAGEKN